VASLQEAREKTVFLVPAGILQKYPPARHRYAQALAGGQNDKIIVKWLYDYMVWRGLKPANLILFVTLKPLFPLVILSVSEGSRLRKDEILLRRLADQGDGEIKPNC